MTTTDDTRALSKLVEKPHIHQPDWTMGGDCKRCTQRSDYPMHYAPVVRMFEALEAERDELLALSGLLYEALKRARSVVAYGEPQISMTWDDGVPVINTVDMALSETPESTKAVAEVLRVPDGLFNDENFPIDIVPDCPWCRAHLATQFHKSDCDLIRWLEAVRAYRATL